MTAHAPTVPLPLPRLAAAEPERLAVRAEGRDVGYAELSALADERAWQLAALGVVAGDRVALRLANTVEHVALIHAIARLDAVLVALHPRLTPDEAAWQVKRARPRVVVDDSGEAGELLRVADEEGETSSASHAGAGPLRADDDGAAYSATPRVADDEGRAPATPYAGADPCVAGDDGLAASAASAAPVVLRPDELARAPAHRAALAERARLAAPQAILFTSGTSGRPKGVVLTWGNQMAAAAASALRIGALPDDRWLAPLPICHVGGLAVVLRCALAGAAILLHDRFDAAAANRALDTDGATVASLVPTMLARVLETRGDRHAPAALRAVLLGGGPAAPDLLRHARALGFPLAPTYGLTEAASQVATAFPGRFEDGRPAALPLPHVEVRVVGDDGRDVSVGAVGEVLVRGPSVMAGYLDEPEATARALRGGWLYTGDAGSLDAAGRLSIAARRDDLIVTGGENVYPAEVEAALLAHPDVLAACVVGAPDPTWGQRVAAAVALREDSTATVAELEASVRRSLAGFKVPRRWRLVGQAELPRTASGKVRRGEVARWFVGPG